MKRSGFKKPTFAQVIKYRNKTRTPIKGGKLPRGKAKPKKKAKSPIKGLKTKLWALCKEIIRLKYGNTCYTCGKIGLAGSSWHTGHFIANSVGGINLRYNLDNLRPQCYYCNIDLGGNGAYFYRKLVEEEGQDYVDNLFYIKVMTTGKADEMFFREKISDYEKVLVSMTHDKVDDLGFIL